MKKLLAGAFLALNLVAALTLGPVMAHLAPPIGWGYIPAIGGGGGGASRLLIEGSNSANSFLETTFDAAGLTGNDLAHIRLFSSPGGAHDSFAIVNTGEVYDNAGDLSWWDSSVSCGPGFCWWAALCWSDDAVTSGRAGTWRINDASLVATTQSLVDNNTYTADNLVKLALTATPNAAIDVNNNNMEATAQAATDVFFSGRGLIPQSGNYCLGYAAERSPLYGQACAIAADCQMGAGVQDAFDTECVADTAGQWHGDLRHIASTPLDWGDPTRVWAPDTSNQQCLSLVVDIYYSAYFTNKASEDTQIRYLRLDMVKEDT